MGPLQSGARFLQFLAPLLINLGETPKNLPTVASTTVVSVCFTQLLLRYSRKMVRSNAVEKMAASSMGNMKIAETRLEQRARMCTFSPKNYQENNHNFEMAPRASAGVRNALPDPLKCWRRAPLSFLLWSEKNAPERRPLFSRACHKCHKTQRNIKRNCVHQFHECSKHVLVPVRESNFSCTTCVKQHARLVDPFCFFCVFLHLPKNVCLNPQWDAQPTNKGKFSKQNGPPQQHKKKGRGSHFETAQNVSLAPLVVAIWKKKPIPSGTRSSGVLTTIRWDR